MTITDCTSDEGCWATGTSSPYCKEIVGYIYTIYKPAIGTSIHHSSLPIGKPLRIHYCCEHLIQIYDNLCLAPNLYTNLRIELVPGKYDNVIVL
jgi:hypothetical protein